jgi:hypothetical protein
MQHDYHTLDAFSQSHKECTSAQASTSAVNVGDDHDECLPLARDTPICPARPAFEKLARSWEEDSSDNQRNRERRVLRRANH